MIRLSLLLLTVLAIALTKRADAEVLTMTLRETLAHAQSALASGDYHTANETFEIIESQFGAEPQVQSDSFQQTFIPMRAYASLFAGDTGSAIEHFESFLKNFPDSQKEMGFVLYNLARAYEAAGQTNNAIQSYQKFASIEPTRPEATLARLRSAELLFQTGAVNDGLDILDQIIAQQPNGILRNKARTSALQHTLEVGNHEAASHYLLDETWSLNDMPDLAILAFSALELGQNLMREGSYDEAVAAFRLVPPYPELLKSQRQRLTQHRVRNKHIGHQSGLFWPRFYQEQIARLEQQLTALEATEDYTTTLYLSRGQAYLLAGRPHEAWILFETLARDPNLTSKQQAEAHYRWILAAIQVAVWDDAFLIAKGFAERFPESPLVPDALYLLATAHQEAGQYRKAIEILESFLNQHPTHQLAPRALFLRGYNYNLLNEPKLARIDFESFIERHPQHGLHKDARLWKALSYLAERDYASTLDSLEDLEVDVIGHRLKPEVAYRIASTLYSSQEYDSALTRILDFLDRYPSHTRAPEGRVLLGDIQMGRGELSKARTIFAAVEPSAGHLFTYAVFQSGKILRAVAKAEDRQGTKLSALESHRKHFKDYVERSDIRLADKTRISEALYWIGWTHMEMGKPDAARQVLREALETYGDDINSDQVPEIIAAFAKIEKGISNASAKKNRSALQQWIEKEKANALATDRLTYFARLNFYLDSIIPTDEPSGRIFETVELVPINRLDSHSLGKIAASLVDRYPNVARTYLEALEEKFPDSRHRTYGYYARATLEVSAGNYELAQSELARFRSESPMHELSVSASLLHAECLTNTQRYLAAQETLEEILKSKHAKGRPHAKALLALSKNAESAGQLKRAIPYAQRVYNVYRAYEDLAAEAYWISALQFEAIGDSITAYRTLEEMLRNPLIRVLPIAEEAARKKHQLFQAIPEGALDGSTLATLERNEQAETQ